MAGVRFKRSRTLRLTLATLSVLAAGAGCAERLPTATQSHTSTSAASDAKLQSGDLSLDGAFATVGQKVPSFSGAYFDADGVLAIRVTNLSDSSAASAAVQVMLNDRTNNDPKRAGNEGSASSLAPKGVRFELAQTEFTRLYELKSRIRARAFDSDEVTFLDLDEKRGLIVLGVTSLDASEKIIAALGLDPDDAKLTTTELANKLIPTQAVNLNGRRRPLAGGFQTGPIGCPLTVSVRRGTLQQVLTAAHCTATTFGVDYVQISQGTSQPGFGYEFADPPVYACGTYFQPRSCRRSDASSFDASNVDLDPNLGETVGWIPGLIARTTYSSNGSTQTTGSIVPDQNSPIWTVTTEVTYPIGGETLHKLGNVTGWTYGAIYKTCVDNNVGYASPVGNVRIVCSDWAAMYNQLGDSGGPVFKPLDYGASTAAFYGIVFAKDGVNGVVFSNLTQMRQDLGPISLF